MTCVITSLKVSAVMKRHPQLTVDDVAYIPDTIHRVVA